MDAYFAYVEDEGGAFRLVFESDLTNEPAVRERVDKVTPSAPRRSARSSREDTGLPRTSRCCSPSAWAASPRSSRATGCSRAGTDRRDDAVQLLASLAWRGIAGFPPHATTSPGSRRRRSRRSHRPAVASLGHSERSSASVSTDQGGPAVEVKIGVQHAPARAHAGDRARRRRVEKAVADALSGLTTVCSR